MLSLPPAVSAREGAENPASLMMGSREVSFTVAEGKGGSKGIALVSLHSNETTSREVVEKLLPRYPGLYVALHAGGQRRLHLRPGRDQVSIDPNRMFTLPGIQRDLKRAGIARAGDAEAVLAFGNLFLETYLSGASIIVAVHNNTDGGYSIKSYQKGGSEARATRQLHLSDDHDPDNFFLVTRTEHFEALAALGYHVVLQSENPPDDGSLSVYAAIHGIPYVNVEAEHGAEAVQTQMMLDLYRILEETVRR